MTLVSAVAIVATVGLIAMILIMLYLVVLGAKDGRHTPGGKQNAN